MSGTRGPIGKRSDERRRENAPEIPITQTPGAGPSVAPAARKEWHPLVKALYQSIGQSGMVVFYQPSDWMVAYLACENLDRLLQPQYVGTVRHHDPDTGKEWDEHEYIEMPIKGGEMQAFLKVAAVLGLTEGDRRRISMELTLPKPGESAAEQAAGNVTSMMDRMMGKTGTA